MEYISEGAANTVIDAARTQALLDQMVAALGTPRRVLLIPPDITRLHSGAGEITVWLWNRLKDTADVEILPALGTHVPMPADQLETMFPGIPHDRFRVHDWRNDVIRLGEVPPSLIHDVSEGKLNYSIACEVNRLLLDGQWDRIVSIGQVVPHEVVGVAGHNKNIFVGVGGSDIINKTHFLGAVYGMERMMGRAASPVRTVFEYCAREFAATLPIVHVLTVRDRDSAGQMVTRGLFAGDDGQCFQRAAALCGEVNITPLEAPLSKVVTYLDPTEYHSTWLGNKAIYRTRLAIADGGTLIILAPGVRTFGEDPGIDALIRKYGYRGTPHTLERVAACADLAENLSAAAHLIHGSSEGRFRIVYCPGGLKREEVEAVGFEYADLAPMLARYDPDQLQDGPQRLPDDEEVYFISNPGLGLWGVKDWM